MAEFQILKPDAEKFRVEMQKKYEELSGRKISKISPEGCIFATVSYKQAIREEYYNDIIKQNYLRYGRHFRLDLFGEQHGDRGLRLKEQFAKGTFRFSITSPKQKNIVVPKGSLIKYGELFFATDEEYTILKGREYVDGIATCTISGTIGNNIEVGHINEMVDMYPYYSKVSNISVTNGGTDTEDDEGYRSRLRKVPDSFSTAGAGDAYKFWSLTASPDIVDVEVLSPQPCEVDIYVLTKTGDPSKELKDKVFKNTGADKRRPLTDKVNVKNPIKVSYDIDLDYYINTADGIDVNLIKKEVERVVKDFNNWQKLKLGRDIIPDELIKELKLIGVKRCVIRKPEFTKIKKNQYACVSNNISINYSGDEDI